MTGRVVKKIAVLIITVAFGLGAGLAFAAEQYCLDKDKLGRCSVRACKAATKTTIAGPFATKAEAQKAKAEKCPPKAKAK
ncbi:MAG TPA: hypothetical protein VMC85_04630 [Desulfomonilaceae bacterium]|nr:hypothetical protein [Desulfomonilaceae bacterium]